MRHISQMGRCPETVHMPDGSKALATKPLRLQRGTPSACTRGQARPSHPLKFRDGINACARTLIAEQADVLRERGAVGDFELRTHTFQFSMLMMRCSRPKL